MSIILSSSTIHKSCRIPTARFGLSALLRQVNRRLATRLVAVDKAELAAMASSSWGVEALMSRKQFNTLILFEIE